MTTIRTTFEPLRQHRESALLPYLTAGYPSLEGSLEILETLIDAGGDIIEIGVPFGDPVADGPTIQEASRVALERGTTLRRLLDALGGFDAPVPLVLMSYLNPLLALGGTPALDRLRASGISGLIVPDLPLEEASGWCAAARGAGIDLIQLTAPTTPEERLRRIAESSAGFVYHVAVTGTTGTRRDLAERLPADLKRLRGVTDLPLAVGFGISEPRQVRRLRGLADGIVVGSRIVEAIRDGEDLGQLIRELKHASRSEDHARADER